MIELYTANTSNGQRAAVLLEECGLPYEVHRVDLMKGEQRSPEFLSINPAGVIPAIVDREGPGGARLVLTQSAAIALYACEKSGRFIPADPVRRVHAMQWLLQAVTDTARMSSMIFMSGVLVPEKSPDNVAFFEAQFLRFLRHADARLSGREYLADEVSIADFALYPIYAGRKSVVDAAGDLPDLTRWAATIAARPAVARGMAAALPAEAP